MPRQWLRDARKSIGLPASDDVGLLAELFEALLEEAEAYIKEPISEAFFTTPHLLALYQEDIQDVYLHLGMPFPEGSAFHFRPLTQETAGAIAGHDLGICPTFWNATTCLDEVRNTLPVYRYMVVSYTRNAFTASLGTGRAALAVPGFFYQHREDFELGSDVANIIDDDDWEEARDEYWTRIRDHIVAVWVSDIKKQNIDKLILIGESAGDVEFVRNVVEQLKTLQHGEVPEILMDDAVFATSKGAAQILLRDKLLRMLPRDSHEGGQGHVSQELAKQGDL
ncbi:MAG: hypothetical protein Q9227_005332 [Pyrenula ochraceoflavens]